MVVAEGNIRIFEPSCVCEPVLLAITRMEGIQACAYTWRSPASQVALSRSMAQHPPAVRAVADKPPQAIATLAALHAYWGLDRAFLTKLAGFLAVHVSRAMSLFDLVHRLVSHSLPEHDPEALLNVCCARMVSFQKQAAWSEELGQVDEAVEVLARNDHEVISSERKKAHLAEADGHAYRAEYVRRRVVAAKARSKVAGRAAPKPPEMRPRALPKWPEQNIDTALAKSMRPPGSSLWPCVRMGNWQGHLEPWPRISRSWSRYGEAGSLNLVLKALWERHCELQGRPLSACPIKGLFTPAELAASQEAFNIAG